jgi:hypothetical protein
MDPATLIVIYTAVSSGKQITHTKEFRDVRECEKAAESWRHPPPPKGVQVKIDCKKWLKIAPAEGQG